MKRFSLLFVAVLTALIMQSGTSLRAAELYVLSDGDLRVEIEVDSDRLLDEFGPRFDRTAVMHSVRVDGVELLGPWGLPDEFGLYGKGVLGHDEAAPGESFIKIGIGRLLRDTEAPYHFAHAYPIAARFPVEAQKAERSLTVRQQSSGEGPWQYEYVKSYELVGANELSITYTLGNIGSTAWRFEHYNHHWFRAEGVPVGPDYRILTAFPLPEADTGFDKGPDWLGIPEPLAPDAALYYVSDLKELAADANRFELRVQGQRAVSFRGSVPPARFALFARADGFCPEMFVRLALEPGETVTWSSLYRFDNFH